MKSTCWLLQMEKGRYHGYFKTNGRVIFFLQKIRVIAKLPNFEQSSKGKGKTHKYTNRQDQSTTGKLGKA